MIQKRTKGLLNADYKIKDIYAFYVKLKNDKKETPVEYNIFKKICTTINKKIISSVIQENYMFILPNKCGNISIRKYKTKLTEIKTINGTKILNYPVDWKATKELWKEQPELAHKKVVYIENDHTNGYRFKFVWNTYNANFKNKRSVAFKPLRKNSRALAKEIKVNENFDAYEMIK